MRTLALYLLFSGAIVGLYALTVATLTSRRVALNGAAGDTPLYAQTCHDAGFDPLEGQP